MFFRGVFCFGCVAVFLAVTTQLQADTVTYSFVDYPQDKNGHNLSGVIVTDGTMGRVGGPLCPPIISGDFIVDGIQYTIDPSFNAPTGYINLSSIGIQLVLPNGASFKGYTSDGSIFAVLDYLPATLSYYFDWLNIYTGEHAELWSHFCSPSIPSSHRGGLSVPPKPSPNPLPLSSSASVPSACSPTLGDGDGRQG